MNFEGRTEIEGPAGGRSKFVARPLCVQRERNDLAKNPATEFAYSLERNGMYSISEIRNLIFAKIFLQIEHLDNQLYLVSDIHGLTRIPDGKCEISWYNELKDKVINLKSIFGSDYYYGLEYIDLKIKTETEYRASLI